MIANLHRNVEDQLTGISG